MSRTTSTKRKGGESLPDPPAKKSKTNAENKPVKKAKLATSTATAPTLDTAAPTPPLKTKHTRKTAADYLDDYLDGYGSDASSYNTPRETRKSKRDLESLTDALLLNQPKTAKQSKDTDNDAAEAVVDKPKASKKSKKSKNDASTTSDAVGDHSKVEKQSKDDIDATTAATDKPTKATKKAKKDKAIAADAVVDNPKIGQQTKTDNTDDLAASRQLRAENGEPVTPAAPAVIAAKKLNKTEKAAKAAEARNVRERAELAARLQTRREKVEAEEPARKKKLKAAKDNQATTIAKKGTGKMNSDDPTTDLADQVKPTSNANGVAADGQGKSSERTTDKTKDLATTDDTPDFDEADLLKGFETDTDDGQDQSLDIRETPPITDPTGEIEKELREAKRKAGPDDEPGTIYIGHIPHGFFEVQMRAFFSQFGDITRIRLSRNRRTGASKHFAFIEFASAEVAKIAAKTMDGYLMFGHILKSKFALADSLHPDLWKGANKKFHKIPHAKLEGQKLAEPKSVEQWDKKAAKEEARRKKKGKAIKEKMGYEVPAGGVAAAKAAKKEL